MVWYSWIEGIDWPRDGDKRDAQQVWTTRRLNGDRSSLISLHNNERHSSAGVALTQLVLKYEHNLLIELRLGDVSTNAYEADRRTLTCDL